MNKYVVYENGNGIARYVVTVESQDEVFVLPGMSALQIPSDADPDVKGFRAAVKNGALIAIPPRPSTLHEWDGDNWIDPRPQSERDAEAWANVRARRNRLLSGCDWVMLSDSPVTGPVRAQWVTYRQALRDITNQPDPYNIVWPVPPS